MTISGFVADPSSATDVTPIPSSNETALANMLVEIDVQLVLTVEHIDGLQAIIVFSVIVSATKSTVDIRNVAKKNTSNASESAERTLTPPSLTGREA